MQKVNGRRSRIAWDKFHAKIRDKVVSRGVRVISCDVAKTGRECVLHLQPRIGGQDYCLIAFTQVLIPEATIVTSDAGPGAGDVDAFKLPNRWGRVQRDRIPNCFGTALAHLVLQREGASSVCSHNFEPTIRGTALR